MVKSSRRASSATPVTASGKRALRYATAYAAHDGERPLKKRALESFAPAAKLLTSSSSLRTSARSSDGTTMKPPHGASSGTSAVSTVESAPLPVATESSATPQPLTSATLQFLRDHCPSAPRSIPSEAVRLVRSVTAGCCPPLTLLSSPLPAGNASSQPATTLRRLLLKSPSLPQIADALALSSLECSFATQGQSVLLVVVEPNTATVEALRLRIATTFAIPTIVVDETSKARCTLHVPLTPESELSKRAAPIVLATAPGLGRLSEASNVWETCGALVVLTSPFLQEFVSQSTSSAAEGATTAEPSLEASRPITKQFRAASLRSVVLLSSSLDMLSNPCWRKWLLGSPIEDDAHNSTNQEKAVDSRGAAAKNSGKSKPESVQTSSPFTTEPLVVHHLTVEGLPRFQAVYGMLVGHSTRCHCTNEGGAAAAVVVVVVHFATPESAAFWFDVVLALQELPETTTTILCDSDLVKERSSTAAPLGDSATTNVGNEKLSAVHAKLNTDVNKALTSAAASRQGSCVIVLSCSAYIPSYDALQGSAATGSAKPVSGTEGSTAVDVVLVQYDAMLSIATYSAFLANARRHCCSGPRTCDTVSRTSKKGESAARSGSGVAVVRFHPLVLLRRNEAPAALPILQASGEAHGVRYVAQPRPPSATVAYLSAQKFMSLHKKMFAIHLKAFEAYRATMQVYSRLRPTEVYRVDGGSESSGGGGGALSLELVGSEFGYTDVPLLDLRTKSTPFRPREDVSKAAKQRLVREQRAKRKFADEHLVGEGPDEDPFHEKEGGGEDVVVEAHTAGRKQPPAKGAKKQNA